jgi:hypothetical protein
LYYFNTYSFSDGIKEMLVKAIAKAGLATGLLGPPVAGGLWFGLIATEQQQESVRSIIGHFPPVLQGGLVRFSRPLLNGLMVGLDYKVSLRGLDDKSDEYQEVISEAGLDCNAENTFSPRMLRS